MMSVISKVIGVYYCKMVSNVRCVPVLGSIEPNRLGEQSGPSNGARAGLYCSDKPVSPWGAVVCQNQGVADPRTPVENVGTAVEIGTQRWSQHAEAYRVRKWNNRVTLEASCVRMGLYMNGGYR